MSTIKITQLNEKVSLDANTSNTILLGVDLPSSTTVKFTLSNLISRIVSDIGTGSYANAAFIHANAAFLQANTPSYVSNSASTYANGAFEQANAAFLVANTPTHVANSAALYSNGAFAQANAAFIVANTPTAIANSAALYANGAFIQANASFLRANTPLPVANSGALYANGAFIQANAAFIRANTPHAISNSAALYANGAFDYANSAFYKANNALANTTGTFDGNLTVTGNIVSKYALTVNNASMPGNSQYIIVTGTATGAIGVPTNPGYTFHSAVDTGNRVVAEAYSNTASDYASFIGRRARGTAANPLAIQSGDTIVRFGGNGYGNTKFSQFADARIEFVATENHTDTAKGTKIRFMNTQDGSNNVTEIATFNADSVHFTGSVTPQKGFVYTPRTFAAAQTAITIDFATDSIIKANTSAGLTVSFTNYVYGKVVKMWITNTSGFSQTFTHGCSSINSTVNATTYSIPSTSTICCEYFSLDSDLANTFVSIIHA
jgi:hypothetical protein